MKYWYILLLVLLLIPCVTAETQIVKTHINITADSWVNENNESRFNLTIKTESAEDPRNYEVNDVNSINNVKFDIRKLHEIACDQTDIGEMVNQCKSYFTECGDLPCKEKWYVCDTQKLATKDLLDGCTNDRINLQKEVNDSESSITGLENQITSKENEISILGTENKRLQGNTDKLWFAIVILVIIAGGISYKFKEQLFNKKFSKSIEQKDVPVGKTPQPPQDFYDGFPRG